MTSVDLAAKLKVPIGWPGQIWLSTVLNPYTPLMVTVCPTGLYGAGGQLVLFAEQVFAGLQYKFWPPAVNVN